MYKIRLCISACLLGEITRYDGEEKLDPYLKYTLGSHFELLPVCPEVECGMSVPREPMRLEGDPSEPRIITRNTGVDKTPLLKRWSKRKLRELRKAALSGFVLKSRSPSCGLKVDVYDRDSGVIRKGRGIFADALMREFPYMPLAEDEDLWQPEERENFIERVISYRDWQEFSKNRKSRKNIIEFHSVHKLQIMSHSRRHLQALGRLVADANSISPSELYERYVALYMDALKVETTRKKHTDVLQHIMGYFKRYLSPDEKRELLKIIEDYRLGRIPLIVPVIILYHYAIKFDIEYLTKQFYLRRFNLTIA